MAIEAGELVVRISADVAEMKAALQVMSQQTQNLGANTVTVGSIMADVYERIAKEAVGAFKEMVEAAGEHEQAMTRLKVVVGQEAAEALNEFAMQLQRTTTYSDDAILSLENQLVQYGIFPGSVKDATAALLNFAAATGKDLPEAGTILAQAMAGNSRQLKQFGLDLSVAATRSENLTTTINFLNNRFGDAAATLRGTTLGSIDALANRFEDLKKRIGEDLLPVANKFVEWAGTALGWVENLINKNKEYSATVDQQKQKLADMVAQLKAQVSNGVQVTKQQEDAIKAQVAYIKQLEKTRQVKQEVKGATDREISSIRNLKDEIIRLQQEQAHLDQITTLGTEKRILGAQMELAQIDADQTRITEITELETQKRLAMAEAAYEAQASYSTQLAVQMNKDLFNIKTDFVNLTSTMINSFAQSTAKMIVEGGRFKDVIKNLWKEIAEAVIAQIIRMIAEWMVWMALTGGGGGALGFFAEGGMIQEPSMITGLKTGRRHIAGEAGPEMVVPMSSMSGSGGNYQFSSAPNVSNGGGGGGGDVNINISGQFIEGSPSKWQKLVRETILPEVRRLTMSTPTGPFNRVRGAI